MNFRMFYFILLFSLVFFTSGCIPNLNSLTKTASTGSVDTSTPTNTNTNTNTDYFVSTYSGTATIGGTTNGSLSQSLYYGPEGIAKDSFGNIYIADTGSHIIRKITKSTGIVSTFAGTAGTSGTTNGTGTAAKFNSPTFITIDSSDNLYVTDSANHGIRKITKDGVVTTLAGTLGSSGTTNGTGTAAKFNSPFGIIVDSTSTNLYVSEFLNHTIRKIVITSGVVTTLAGVVAVSGKDDGDGTTKIPHFNAPTGLVFDANGNLLVADYNNHAIRKVTMAGAVSTVAGKLGTSGSTDDIADAARFFHPTGIAKDSNGDFYIVDTQNNTIRKMTASHFNVSTVAGTAAENGILDGNGGVATFFTPMGIVIDSLNQIYITDTSNNTIRLLTK
jgi:hypothetical protein